MAEFKYEINEDFDYTIDEKGNSYIALRKIKWNGSDSEKLDLRKYFVNSDGDEVMGKGVSFITEDGPHCLVETLIEQGYGDTKKILELTSKREDFVEAIEILKDDDNEVINELDNLFE